MKREVLKLGFGLLSAFLLVSCNDDVKDIYVSYGVIRNVTSDNNYEILTDKGNTLAVTKSWNNIKIENDKRALVNYEILSDKDKDKKIYEVQVNGFYYLLSKPVVYESFIQQDEEARRDSIGNDPFLYVKSGFGSDYININFEIYHSQYTDKKHLINLVYNDSRVYKANEVANDTVYLALRHNAYGEVPEGDSYLYRGLGRCSFKISDLLPEGVTSAPVKLTWTQYEYGYETKECSDTKVFKTGENTDEASLAKTGFEEFVEIQ